MKVIAFYLPQFHEIPENNAWWGDGFTEWVNVKNAKPLFPDHYQPRVPLGNNYYNLLDADTIRWQARIAKEHGIFGFAFYHYWFDGHMLLEKPVDLFLENKDIDISYCISWANEDWTNRWADNSRKTLISQTYGNESDWKKHYEYLRKHFADSRYIRVDGKPLMILYRPELIPCLDQMLDCWTKLAEEDGFGGLSFAYQHVYWGLQKHKDDSRFRYQIEYQPLYAFVEPEFKKGLLRTAKKKFNLWTEKNLHTTIHFGELFGKKSGPEKIPYERIWQAVLTREPESEKNVPGAFVDWDNTPRHRERGRVVTGATPEKFYVYFKKQIQRARQVYHKDLLFLFAWNEWGEGGYLEPDERYRDRWLKAVKRALLDTGEFPEP